MYSTACLSVCLSPLSPVALCYNLLFSTACMSVSTVSSCFVLQFFVQYCLSVSICFVSGTICCIVLYVCLSPAALCYNSLNNTLRILWAGCIKNRCRAAVASVACCGVVRCGAARRSLLHPACRVGVARAA